MATWRRHAPLGTTLAPDYAPDQMVPRLAKGGLKSQPWTALTPAERQKAL